MFFICVGAGYSQKNEDSMTNRSRIPDQKTAGRSRIVPFFENESYKARHARRLDVNLDNKDQLRDWCKDHGVQLFVSNQSQHWRIVDGEFLAEWWPSTAKLVFEKRYGEGVHCHDYRQLMDLVGERLSDFRERVAADPIGELSKTAVNQAAVNQNGVWESSQVFCPGGDDPPW